MGEEMADSILRTNATFTASVRIFYMEMADSILRTNATFTASVRIFYMPQSYDMGQTALLPLRRKAC
jgi:hypothetical protein